MKNNTNLIAFLENTNPWWENARFRFKSRDREYYLSKVFNKNKLIKLLIGARRVGKTHILFSAINNLLEQNLNPKKIIFINADLREVRALGLRNAIEMINKVLKINYFKTKTYVIVDEIQELDNWQEELKLLYDSTKIQFLVSGSSATLLTHKSSKLTGRFEMVRVLPLSLGEYIQFNSLKNITKSNKDLILKEYLLNGGYPERLKFSIPGYLKEIIDSTLYRDLLDTYGIRNAPLLEDILKLLADKVTTGVTPNKIATNLKIDNTTASNYLKYLESVYLIYPLFRNAGSNRLSKNYPVKYYFNDTGVLNELSIRPRIGHLAENAVFLELLRRQYSNEKYELYYDVINNQEYDFKNSKNTYKVKYDFDEIVLTSKIAKYEKHDGSDTRPILIGTDVVIKVIIDNAFDMDYENIFEFLMGS